MIPLPLLLSLAIADPTRTHEAVAGATAGRSPHVARRELAPRARPCGLVRHPLPAGKLPVLGSHHACDRPDAAARAPGGGPAPGR